MERWRELEHAVTVLTLQAQLIESLQREIVMLRAERDEARMVRGLICDVDRKIERLSARIVAGV